MNNLSEFLRDNLRSAWGSEGVDFSNPDWRKTFFSNLCNSDDGVKIGLLQTKHQSLFHHQIKKIIKENGADPRSYGMTSPNKTFTSTTGGMSGEITPKPKPTDKNLGDGGQQQSQSQSTGMVPAGTAPQGQGGQSPNPEEPRVNFTPKTTGLTVKMMFSLLRLKFPALESLDDDEIEALGEAWNPIFNRYLAGVAGIWMTALFTTGMVITSKIADAKKKDPNAFGKKKEDKQVKNATEPEEPPEETESTEPKEESGWLSKMGTDKADKRNES